jgi:imidazoleglycerol-phosphate dehydratase / histidinol-phosphatase
MIKKKILFIDRDGTLVKEPNDNQLDSFAKLEFYPKVFENLGKITRELNFELVMVTNQDGLGTESFPDSTFWPVHTFILNSLENEGIVFSEVFIDKSYPQDKLNTRKPETGMLTKFIENPEYDLNNSFVIGDRLTDVALAKNLGAKAIFINPDEDLGNELMQITSDELTDTIAIKTLCWEEIYNFLKIPTRKATISRTTKETDIFIHLSLDGDGSSYINTGIDFFNHMLDQVSKHAHVDLEISVKGDLNVDEHHTIEDTAIALGEAFSMALDKKVGIERYGFCLPMDDCLAQVAIDFGGRSWLVWDADFNREMIGKMPTEMFYHFFKSFCDGAKANLNIKAEGKNEHHKIEAIFKAFAKAVKMAVKRDSANMTLPSTKGII